MATFWELPIDARNVFANWFIGNTDPALDPDNRVTTGKPWIQTTNDTAPYGPVLGLFMRDSDSTWKAMLSSGPTGATGATGAAGTNGADGSVIRSGAGAPSNGLGVNGDWYIDTSNGNLWQKAAGVYGVITNIIGPAGVGVQGPPGLPGQDGIDGSNGDPGPTGPPGATGPAASVGPEICCGRLTLESGVAVSTSDQTGKTTIYWTPYKGARIALYNGATWDVLAFVETSLALGTLTSGSNYDVFGYNNSGTLALELLAWTNNTTRATALVLQDGVWSKTGVLTRRYLGTFRTTSTTTTEDSAGGTTTQVGGKRFVWSYYNRVPRELKVIDTTSTWAYGTDTWRQANGASGNKIEYVCGLSEELVNAMLSAFYSGTTNSARIGRIAVGLDSTTTPSTFVAAGYNNAAVAGQIAFSIPAPYVAPAGLGYHYLAWMEKGADGTSVFWGSNAGVQSGLAAWMNG